MIFVDKIVKKFCVTEKATSLSSTLNHYTFDVSTEVNRIEVAKAIEALFKVSVTRVNILNRKGKVKRSKNQRGKQGRTASSKRAIVSLKKGDKIEII